MKRPRRFVLVAALTALVPATLGAQLAPASTGGAPALDRLLQQLAERRRLLMIGAHPDDEDTRLLALLARGFGVEAAYLALSRGEGGQNLIGDELGVPLGLLRAQELQAARGIDGARQFFTRAYDFGYTRSLEETQRFWPPEAILEDVVRVIRRFRPHVVVSVFRGTRRDGHGQHQMAGVVARRGFEVAGDANAFPALARDEGLAEWQPLKLYRATRFDRAATTVTIPTGGIDPRLGKTYHQIAMASRSRHRSQDFGVIQATGPRVTRLGLVESGVSGASDDGLWDGIPRESDWLTRLADSLRRVTPLVAPEQALPALVAARGRLGSSGGRRTHLLNEAVATAAGVVVDGRTEAGTVVPGEPFAVTVEVYNAGSAEVVVRDVALPFRGASIRRSGVGDAPATVPAGSSVVREYELVIPPGAEPTQPYFLERSRQGALYDWSGAPPAVRGLPFGRPDFQVVVTAEINGAPVTLTREVTHRFADQAIGEVREPVRVVPAIGVRLAPTRIVWSSEARDPRAFTVTLTSHGADTLRGSISLDVDGWPAPPAERFQLTRRGEVHTARIRVRRPAEVTRGAVTVRAVARTDGGAVFDRAVELVTYPHIRPTPYVQLATSEVRVAPVRVPAVNAVGYVRGASDRVPGALLQLGLPLVLLDDETLARGDLSRFDAIIVGARAYETDSALVRHNDRLLGYVERGGHLLVQYQQYQFERGGYAPYPLEIDRPHDRITDETAPVRMLDPEHPVFHRPHRIRAVDFEGWPQERGLYFAGTWDDRYRPLLEMQDPGMAPVRGGLLVARYGEGTYVYTGISFFRSLPAGVPGAARLFLNVLALGVSDEP